MDKIVIEEDKLEKAFGIKEGKSGIDRSYEDEHHKGVIKGFAVITKGFVKDERGWAIDDVTLEQTVEASKRITSGVKSRFGHPNICTTAFGKRIGRARNFRKDGDIVRADLYLSKAAHEAPAGKLAQYVLDLAEHDPESFGASIVLQDYELEYALEENGVRKKNKDGKEFPPMLRVKSLLGVDMVDEPAANNGVFSKINNPSLELSAKATEFLNKLLANPDALEFVISFLERYRVNRADIDEDKKQPKQVLNKTEDSMELKDLTVEQLKKERPEIVSSFQNETIKEERSRCSAIVKASNKEFSGMGMEAIVEESIDNGKTVDASLAAMRGKRLEDLKQNSNKAPGADQGDPEKKKSHLEIAKEYQREHKCSLQEALSMTAEPRAKK
jgi:hypothetical protein